MQRLMWKFISEGAWEAVAWGAHTRDEREVW
jgi:hypothetical protein